MDGGGVLGEKETAKYIILWSNCIVKEGDTYKVKGKDSIYQ
jgi:hypothetical protein